VTSKSKVQATVGGEHYAGYREATTGETPIFHILPAVCRRLKADGSKLSPTISSANDIRKKINLTSPPDQSENRPG
jgi:hypothetical protein